MLHKNGFLGFRDLLSFASVLLAGNLIATLPAFASPSACENYLRTAHPSEANSFETVLVSENIHPVPKSLGDSTIILSEGSLCVFRGKNFYRVIHVVEKSYNSVTNELQQPHVEDVRWESNMNAGNPNPNIRAVSQKIQEDDLTLLLEKRFENGLIIRYVIEKRATALAYASTTYRFLGIFPRLNLIHNDEYLIR